MVYEKYIKKRGKVYGPYLYENKRVNGKVVTSYLGPVSGEINYNGKKLYLFFSLLAVILLLFFVFYGLSPTGRVSLDVKSDYKAGEQLSGKLRLNIKEGELVPKDSKVLVSLGDITKEFSLSELIDKGVVSGEFFVENFGISGNGEGYGVAGERIVYPLVDFDLRVFGVGKEKGKYSGGEERVNRTKEDVGGGSKIEEEKEENKEEGKEEGEKKDELGEGEEKKEEGLKTGEEKKETGEIKEKEEGEKEVIEPKGGEEVKGGEKTVESGSVEDNVDDKILTESNEGQQTNEQSEDSASQGSGEAASSGADSETNSEQTSLTGSAVSESEFIISGTVSKGEEFSYNLEEGQDAEIVSGSVKVNGSAISDSSIKLEVRDSNTVVSTDYSIVEKGFGNEYLGDKELKLEIDISKFGLIANDSTILNIKLVFSDRILVEVEEDISVVEEEIEEILNESEGNESLVLINETNIAIEKKFSNLSLIKDIPNIRIAKNLSASLNLSEYFAGAEGYEFNVSELIAVFDANIMVIRAEEGFTGMRKAKVIAYSGNEKIEGNEFNVLVSSGAISISKLRKKVVVGEPVVWRMNVSLSEFENVSIELPVGAENITVKKIINGNEVESTDSVITGMISAELELDRESGFMRWLKGLFGGRLTGRAVNEAVNETNLANNVIQVELKDEAKEYVIEYNTKGPEAREEEINRGKRVIVSGDDIYNYTDVIASSKLDNRIPIDKISKIKVYWNVYEGEGGVIVKDVEDVENESIVEKIDSSEFVEEIEEVGENKSDVVEDEGIIVNETEIVDNVSENVVNESNVNSINDESIENVNESRINDINENIAEDNSKNEAIGGQISSSEGDNAGIVSGEEINASSFGITGVAISEIDNGNNDSIINETVVLNGTKGSDENVAINSNSGKQEIPFDAYDLDEDGFIDYIEWVVPHLSEQRFDIIYITRAEHLDDNRTFIEDVFELVKARDDNWTEPIPSGDYLRVMFERNLTSSNDITIYARSGSGNASIEVYEKDKNELIAKFSDIFEDKKYRVILEELNGTQDIFDLKIQGANGGVEFDYVVDPTSQLSACSTLNTADTIYYLINNISSIGNCLTVTANNITIEGNGSSITYGTTSTLSNVHGINVKGANGTQINNVWLIKEGRYGTGTGRFAIRFSDAYNGTIFNNSIFTNTTSSHGIALYNTSFVNITGNNFNISTGGTGSGILLTRSSNNTIISNNINVSGSGDVIEVVNSNNNSISFNYVIGSAGGVGIQLNTANDTLVYSNIVNMTGTANGIHLTADTYRNNLSFNIVQTSSSEATLFETNLNNLLFDSFFFYSGGSGVSFDGAVSGAVNFTNVSFVNNTARFFGVISTAFNVHWYLDSQVNDTSNKAVANANVSGYNATGGIVFSVLTDSNGFIQKQQLLDYRQNSTDITYYSNYTINATKAGYSTASKPLNVTLVNNSFMSFVIDGRPDILFVAPTLANGSTTSNGFVEVNVSILDDTLKNVVFNWNATNYTIFNDSLVLYLNMNNYSALGDNETHVKDISILGNNGTCMQISQTQSADISTVSACNQTLGKWGLGIRFNGKNETLNVSDKSSLDIGSSFSLAAWINVADLPISNNVDGIIGKGTNDTTGGYNYNYLLAIRRDSGPVNPKLSLIFGDGTKAYDVNYSFSYSLNRWYHVAGVFDDSANTLTLYQDGVQVGQSTGIAGTPAVNALNVLIGGATMTSNAPSGYGPDYFNGTIDEVMIWNRSLGATEIEQLYKSSLYKINRTSWVLYVNQTKNITEALDEKVYTYYVFASDVGGSGNSTDTRSVRVDSVPLNISFVAPTLANGSSTSNASVEINISLLENNLKNVIFNWNGTNYTIYNNTLVLMYNMNNLSALGENATHVTDISNYSNNGSIVNWGSAFFNSSEGKFNGGYQFNGSGYITRAYDSDFDFGTNGFAVETWFKQSDLNPKIIRVQRTTNSTASGSGTVVTCTLGAAATSGNLLVTAVGSDKSAGTYTVPSGFTMINTTSATSTSGGLAFKIANGTETIIRWSQSTSSLNGITCWAAEYSGLVTSGVVDVSAENETFSGGDTATTTINSGITNVTSQADELAIVMVSIDTATNCDGSRARTGGFSEEAFLDASTGLMVANKTLSSKARQNTTYSCSGDTGDQMYAAIATFKAIIRDSTIAARYDNDQGFKLWMNSSGNILFGIDDDATWNPDDLAVSGTGYDNNIWHHAIGVRNGTGIYLYVDGQLVGSDISIAATSTLSSDSAPLSWGVDEPTDQYFWNGSLDEARVWNYGLSAGDVLEHYFSNLYRVNTTNWLLYVNQSKNASDGLDTGTYTYYAFASDTASVGNVTDTRTVTVGAAPDTASPLVTINFPANTTYGFSNRILNFSVSLNENGSVMYSLNGGRNNKTMLYSVDNISVFGDLFNHTNSSIADGQYVFSVYANDTTGNKNYTENITFSVDFTFPKINLSSPANNSNLIGNNSAVLNWTINDTSNNNEIFVWATNDSANLYDYLVYHRKDQVNGTHAYNWSAPVLRADPTTTVLLLHFNNLSAYGENDTVAADFAQFDNNASITGFETPRWNETSGLLAGSFEMNGLISKTNISIADANALDLKNFTIAMWFLQRGSGDTASSGSGGVVVVPLIAKAVAEADGDGRDVNFMLGVNTSNNLAADFEDSAGPNHPVIGSQDVISNNVWYHVVYTHNYTTSTIYLNGKVSKMSVINSQPANNAIRVGIGQTYNSANVIDGAFNGTIDELIIYNASLSQDEIILLYNHSLGKKYWQVNVTDGAGNMNNSFIYEFNMTVGAAAPAGDTTPPNVTINNPLVAQNISTSSLMFNVSLSENGSVMYSLDGGRNNKTMLFSADHVSVFGTEFNHTNNSIADGIYAMNVYANDTSGNKNYTENRTFTIDTTLPVPSYRTPRNLANGTQVNQSSVFIELDIVDLNFKNVTFGLYNDSAYFNESSLDYHYGYDLARYQRVMNNSNLALAVDSSDITFNPVNETLFVIHNTVGSESIDEIYINGSLRRSITLTGFHDTEAITYVNTSGGTHRFVVGEEQRANLTAIFIDDSTTTFARTSGVMYDLGLGNWANLGLEGVTYDSRRDVYYIVKEQRDMLVYQINVSTSPVTSTILINVTQINATQGQVVNDLSSLYYDNNTDTLFLSSHESQHAYNIYRNGTFINNISLNHMTQPEGITFSRFGDYMYVIGEADFLSSWKTANVSSSINYTGLANGTYYYNVTAYDYAGNRNASITRTIILGTVGAAPANVAPTTPTPDINSTRGTNRTSENLHCFDTLIDPDGGRLNVSVDWFNKTTLHVAIDYNNSYANNTFFESTLGHLNTTNGENWTCGMRLFDGTDYSARVNTSYSVNVTALAVPTLSSPGHASNTTDRTPNFTWSANTDDATDVITYQLNVTLIAASTCSEASRHISSISGTSHEVASELMCFIDNNDYYNWSVRLTDTRETSSWSSFFSVNISSEITLSMINATVQFGSKNNSQTDDTSDDDPPPLVIRNDGNAFINVTINASNLWNTQPNPSVYYQFKISNYSYENASFNWAGSKTTYTNMPAGGSPLFAIALLNHTNATDSAEIDINITVPADETSGNKRSFISFVGTFSGVG